MVCKCQEKQTSGHTQAIPSKVEETPRISSQSTTQPQRNKESFVSRLVYRERLEVCKECEKVKYLLGRMRCGECGCFLELKAAVSLMKCPLGKWAH